MSNMQGGKKRKKPGRRAYLVGRIKREAKAPQTLAIGLIQDAKHYVEAAEVLPTRRGRGLVVYHLLGHAIELALKAHLASCGVAQSKLTVRIGHDLKLAFRYARR